jgi:uncharacterized C2H2 Zn-finger protein
VTDVAEFQCRRCGDLFASVAELNDHTRTIHSRLPGDTSLHPRDTVQRCAACGGWFGTRADLDRHARIAHGSVRPAA